MSKRKKSKSGKHEADLLLAECLRTGYIVINGHRRAEITAKGNQVTRHNVFEKYVLKFLPSPLPPNVEFHRIGNEVVGLGVVRH